MQANTTLGVAHTWSYTAIIRTYKSFPIVRGVIQALRAQTLPPAQVVVVDSGSPAQEQDELAALSDVFIRYPDEPFNYSKAINIGIGAVKTPYVLTLSSHYMLDAPWVIERCVNQADQHGVQAFFITNRCDAGVHAAGLVTSATFDGGNGYSNSCGMLPTAFVKMRPFREELFACEDQEWAQWYLREMRRSILKVSTPGARYLNHRVNQAKALNEELAIACFIDPKRLALANIFKWALRSLVSLVKLDPQRARFKLILAWELLKARKTPPQRASRYFSD
jgi:glycosyltransferase involved in cell wall biosynthesis